MTEWYCDISGEVVGPLKSSQLVQMVRTGEVTRDTLIRKDDSQWVPAMEVNGLFDAATKEVKSKSATLGYICPYCGDSVAKAPTECGNCERYLNRVIPIKEEPSSSSDSSSSGSGSGSSKGESLREEKAKDLNAWQRFWSMD